ncbi:MULTISPECIES: plasmid segregation centromere-binding protein ParR [unclassified Nostoc]|uniref:plasmid segregation centromere-binding protein ParR n=1 Tax=unclassified Nostoc TaxID=2593658 RepID=UPI002AD41EB4|nr:MULTISPECIES: plasmid segregation centromere-binding protein ParR [unclassified Nostoc]MDZ8122364.1 plasmid segregation centromere-binding protein ParR [Nostoc sp. CmiVER01]MDZ8227208.1 plasmid segregation centromere-binding protein ParR [Nostoc sp. ChiVER01]
MFQWSKKVVKSVTFNPELADESLLAQVESYLDKQPDKTFSDLCKEALWQSLCVPEPVQPAPQTAAKTPIEQQIGELQRQVAGLEERFLAKGSNRLEAMEHHLLQLSQQVAQLALIVNERSLIQSPTQLEVVNNTSYSVATPPQEVDPVISRLSQFLDDF